MLKAVAAFVRNDNSRGGITENVPEADDHHYLLLNVQAVFSQRFLRTKAATAFSAS